jgi:hypothetical protein
LPGRLLLEQGERRMTKDELKKEAEEFIDSKKSFWRQGRTCIDSVRQAYIAGAEPREKRIEELEAEVKEWKDKADLWCKTANLKDHNIMINKELEKENAKLKEKLKPENCLKLLAKEGYIKFTSEQLTKAKELLKRFIELENCTLDYDDIKEAEQFISEVEK